MDFHRFEVDDVEARSPAQLAGAHKGDIITEINGASASELDLEKMDEILRQDGHTIRVTIRRDQPTFRLIIKLKARI